MDDQSRVTSSTALASAEELQERRAALLFVRMWAVAHIIHLVSATGSRLDSPWNVLVVVAALVLLLRPSAGRWLALMAVAQLCDLVAEMPFSPDHWMLLGFVNLAFLVTMLARRSLSLHALTVAFPAVRVIVLITYGAAALAKYNTAFLDPVRSCATAIAEAASYGVARQLDAGPVWVASVLAIETSVPILLAIPRTRRHGVRLAMAFHFVLSASPVFAVVDYTGALFAIFLLFLPVEDVGRVLDGLGRVARRSAIVRDANRAPWVTAALALLLFGFLGYLSGRAAAAVVLVASEIYLLAMLLAVLAAWRTSRGVRAFGRPAWVHVPVLILVLLWVFSPYLGLRTTAVFTMFSGIRTEGPAPNHLFLPALRLTNWQDEFVVIQSTNDPALGNAEGGALGVPLMALRRLATDNPDLVVVGTINGESITYGPKGDQTRLIPLAGWEYKLLHFRPVAVAGQRFCSVS